MGLRLLTAAALIVAIAAGAGPPQVEAGAPATLLIYSLDGWVWRADVDGSDRVRVARGLHPEISPDGRWVAFLRRTRARDVHELRVAALDGRTRKLVRRGRVWSYAWLPDSTRLLIHDADAGVLLSHRRGGPATRLARHRVEDGGTINAVSIAPDATLVVFDRSDRRGIDVFAVPVGGGAERRLTVDGNSHAPLAGPTAIAFTRWVGGRRAHKELWLMDADGTNQRRLSQT